MEFMPQPLLHLQDFGSSIPPGRVLFSRAVQHTEVPLADCDLPGTSSKERWSEELKALLLYQLIFIHKLCHVKVCCFEFGGH